MIADSLSSRIGRALWPVCAAVTIASGSAYPLSFDTSDSLRVNVWRKGPSAAHAPPDLDLVISPNALSNGDQITGDVEVNKAIGGPFDAYCAVILPDNSLLSFLGANKLKGGLKPIAKNMPGVEAGFNYRILDMEVSGVAPGRYTFIVGVVPAKAAPSLAAAISYDIEEIEIRRYNSTNCSGLRCSARAPGSILSSSKIPTISPAEFLYFTDFLSSVSAAFLRWEKRQCTKEKNCLRSIFASMDLVRGLKIITEDVTDGTG